MKYLLLLLTLNLYAIDAFIIDSSNKKKIGRETKYIDIICVKGYVFIHDTIYDNYVQIMKVNNKPMQCSKKDIKWKE